MKGEAIIPTRVPYFPGVFFNKGNLRLLLPNVKTFISEQVWLIWGSRAPLSDLKNSQRSLAWNGHWRSELKFGSCSLIPICWGKGVSRSTRMQTWSSAPLSYIAGRVSVFYMCVQAKVVGPTSPYQPASYSKYHSLQFHQKQYFIS